jgi:hypothetical protein
VQLRLRVRDHLGDRFAADDLAGAVVEHAVFGEGRGVGFRVAEVERKERVIRRRELYGAVRQTGIGSPLDNTMRPRTWR